MPGDTLNIPPINMAGSIFNPHPPVQPIQSDAQPADLSAAQVNVLYAQQVQQQSERMMDQRHERWPLLKEITPVRMKRRVNQPTFRLQFDNLTDIHRRLLHSLIYIGGDLYYVSEIHEEGANQFMLYLTDKSGERCRCPFSHPDVNLRTPEPRYISFGSQPYFFFRTPVREQSQGLHSRNSWLRAVFGQLSRVDPQRVLKPLNRHDTLQWSDQYARLMMEDGVIESIRLSNNIALKLKTKKAKEYVAVEYRGRPLGVLRENTIVMDELDFDKRWIRRDVELIGCHAKAGDVHAT